MYVFSSFCIYLIFVIFGHVFIGPIVVSYTLCFVFLLLYLLTKFSLNYTHAMHQQQVSTDIYKEIIFRNLYSYDAIYVGVI